MHIRMPGEGMPVVKGRFAHAPTPSLPVGNWTCLRVDRTATRRVLAPVCQKTCKLANSMHCPHLMHCLRTPVPAVHRVYQTSQFTSLTVVGNRARDGLRCRSARRSRTARRTRTTRRARTTRQARIAGIPSAASATGVSSPSAGSSRGRGGRGPGGHRT